MNYPHEFDSYSQQRLVRQDALSLERTRQLKLLKVLRPADLWPHAIDTPA